MSNQFDAIRQAKALAKKQSERRTVFKEGRHWFHLKKSVADRHLTITQQDTAININENGEVETDGRTTD